jgi:hypothetical protein
MNVLSQNKRYSVGLQSCEAVLKDLGSFVLTAMETIDVEEMAEVIKSIATCSVNLIAGLERIVAKLDLRNDAADFMPPALPHQLVKLRGQEFAEIVIKQKERLFVRGSPQTMECIERDFEGLRGAYYREPSLKQLLDQCRSTTTFDEGWSYVNGRFGHLKEFCGAWPLHFLARLL